MKHKHIKWITVMVASGVSAIITKQPEIAWLGWGIAELCEINDKLKAKG